jgi:probable rRNA maturation factor
MTISAETAASEGEEPGSSPTPDGATEPPEPGPEPEPEPGLHRDRPDTGLEHTTDAPAVDVVVAPDAETRVGEPAAAEWIGSHLAEATAHLETPVVRVGVRIIDDAEMTVLHERYSGCLSTTDVLTFPTSAPGEPIEVDIAVNADEARRQADERGHPLRDELLLYALHGLLHCAGYDDHTPADFEAMHAAEDRILTALGVGPRFGERGDRS